MKGQWQDGSAPLPETIVECPLCAALVVDQDQHAAWHTALDLAVVRVATSVADAAARRHY